MRSMHFMTIDIVDWMRDLLFKDFSAAMDTYERTFEAWTEPEDASVPLDPITLLPMRRRLLALGHTPMLLSTLKRFLKPTINLSMNPLNQHTLIAWQQLGSRASSMSTTRRGKSWLTARRQTVELWVELVVVYIGRYVGSSIGKHYIEIFL